jgi:hypothetical protein
VGRLEVGGVCKLTLFPCIQLRAQGSPSVYPLDNHRGCLGSSLDSVIAYRVYAPVEDRGREFHRAFAVKAYKVGEVAALIKPLS